MTAGRNQVAERSGLRYPRHFFNQQRRFVTGEAAQQHRAFFELFTVARQRIAVEKKRGHRTRHL
jgi:hypothetical protein